ncbi:hypothetical protein [Pseudalkalibacillus caeni]|uniref:Uncharacterized protein n=1 Tax=Exobacillus caeni TaxID=2574798 RepID=A0A5R9F1M0_9BACL|nr:hypothetical protein [Pseudalkalibacillus caeni]TLS37467.1 hypothetical protein FCL54_09990 [Pseudalkalibacillus caeni]
MDINVLFKGLEQGKIRYESLPSLQYVMQEAGFKVDYKMRDKTLDIQPGLSAKRVSVIPLAQNEMEQNVVKLVKRFLKTNGVELISDAQSDKRGFVDLRLQLDIGVTEHIYEPEMQLIHSEKGPQMTRFLQNECTKEKLTVKVIENNDHQYSDFAMILKLPEGKSDMEPLLEKFSVMLTMGILDQLRETTKLPLLSFMPLINFLQIDAKKTVPIKENSHAYRKQLSSPEKATVQAEVFFDYQLILNRKIPGKIKLLCDLHIQNTGNRMLTSPVICLRSSPADSINVTGQILPPKRASTLGVQTNAGTIGWKFIYDNWLDQLKEKGEAWITSIHKVQIEPGQTETLSNIQMSLLEAEQVDNFIVEGFVFFKEQGVEFEANNSISVSLQG